MSESIHVEAYEANLQGLENIEAGKINLNLAQKETQSRNLILPKALYLKVMQLKYQHFPFESNLLLQEKLKYHHPIYKQQTHLYLRITMQ